MNPYKESYGRYSALVFINSFSTNRTEEYTKCHPVLLRREVLKRIDGKIDRSIQSSLIKKWNSSFNLILRGDDRQVTKIRYEIPKLLATSINILLKLPIE